MRRLLSIFFVLFCLATPIFGNLSLPVSQENAGFQKIYVLPDQVILTQEGIFYLSSGGILCPATIVASDAQGIYVIAAFERCPACNRVTRDGVCANPNCPMYGK